MIAGKKKKLHEALHTVDVTKASNQCNPCSDTRIRWINHIYTNKGLNQSPILPIISRNKQS